MNINRIFPRPSITAKLAIAFVGLALGPIVLVTWMGTISTSPGCYVEVSRRFGSFEPVVRWSQLLDAEVDGSTVRAGMEQLAIGLNYWVFATVPLKAAYLYDPDLDDQIVLQWAFGF